jgi:hypothetical protein
MEVHNEKTEMKTLSSCMNRLQENGFTSNLMVKEGKLHIIDTEKSYAPGEVRIANFYRFEGESDPADTSILYAIETYDGHKGIISDAYGVYADEGVSEFLQSVEEIMKRTDRSNNSN